MKERQDDKQNKSLERLVIDYISVCNQALQQNLLRMPAKQLIDASRKQLKGRVFDVSVHTGDEASPPAHFAVRFNEMGRLELDRSREETETGIRWEVDRSELEKVVNNSGAYIDDPLKLDWRWLTAHLGVE